MNTKCKLCGEKEVNIFHIIASCAYFSSNLYLHSRHNPIAKNIYGQVILQRKENRNIHAITTKIPLTIAKLDDVEIWWDKPIIATNKYLTTDRILLFGTLTAKHVK